jgi:hypothetical protein
MESQKYDLALEKFRRILTSPETKQQVRYVIESRDAVLARYRPVFQFENIVNLTEDDFRSFLYFENNRHWSGLYRHVTTLTEDMDALREAITILLNPALPLASRYDKAVGRMKGLGKAVATAILLVSSPNEYGVWNNTSEQALKQVGLWSVFVRGKTPGQQYERLNQLLKQISGDLGIDLWTLDALMWGIFPEDEEAEAEIEESLPPLESVPHSFLNEIHHPALKVRLARLSSAPLDTVIREAGVMFEHHLRGKADPNSSKHGVDLIDDALKPGGKLVFSSHPGEQQGIQFLFRGAVQFIRNPPMHRIIDYPESMAQQFLRLIDSLMILLDHAAMAGEITVDDIRYLLRQKPLRPNHLALFRILYQAGNDGIEGHKLADAMKLSPQQLSGVLGSLGSRINHTEGLEDKGGVFIVFDISETPDGEWKYTIRPILQKALEAEGLI